MLFYKTLTEFFASAFTRAVMCLLWQGPYRFLTERIEQCPPEMLQLPFLFKVQAVRDRRQMDAWYYSLNYTINFPFSDDYNVRMSQSR